jgi:hypothetical protein
MLTFLQTHPQPAPSSSDHPELLGVDVYDHHFRRFRQFSAKSFFFLEKLCYDFVFFLNLSQNRQFFSV